MAKRAPIKIGVAIAAVALAIAGCSSSKSHNSTSTKTSNAPLLAAGPFSPDTLDPDPQGAVDEQTNFMIAAQYTGSLLTVEPSSKDTTTALLGFNDNLEPDLAASYAPLPSGLGYKFKLRSGVVSNYGNPLTAEDVAWTYQRVVQTKAIGYLLFSLGNVNTADPVTVTGPLTFTLNLTAPSPIVLDELQISALGILDKVAVQKNAAAGDPWGYNWLKDHVAGFGPYVVSSFTPQSQVTLIPNPRYFGTKPAVKKIIFREIPDAASRLQLLLGGEINLDWQASPTDYPALKKAASKFTAHFDNAALFTRILLNVRSGSGPQTNVLVRRAIQDAIDRTSIANAVLPGGATPANSCAPNGVTPFGFTHLTNTTASVDTAKKLLAQAGYPNGVTITAAANYGVTIADLPAAVQFLQTQLQAAGITLKIQSFPTQPSYLAAAQKGVFEATIDTFQPFVADAGFFMGATLTTGKPGNYGGYSNPTFDALMASASKMAPGDARNKVLAEGCGIITSDAVLIPIINIPTITATTNNVQGVYDYPDLQLHFDKMTIS